MKAGLRRHANTHDPQKGSDPLVGFLHWGSNTDSNGLGLTLTTTEGINLDMDDSTFVVWANGATWDFTQGSTGVINADSRAFDWTTVDGSNFDVTADGDLTLTSVGVMNLTSLTSPLTITVNGNTFRFQDDGTLHIPTGGSVIADT